MTLTKRTLSALAASSALLLTLGACGGGDGGRPSVDDISESLQDSDMMGQMASFSTLEQVTNMAAANAAMAANLQLSQSVGLIGRTVTWTGPDSFPRWDTPSRESRTSWSRRTRRHPHEIHPTLERQSHDRLDRHDVSLPGRLVEHRPAR